MGSVRVALITVMKNIILILIIGVLLQHSDARPQEGEAPVESPAVEGEEENDMMAADRVMAVDEGKEAFQDMVAAVNNADERVKALDDDLNKALSNAESAPMKYKK